MKMGDLKIEDGQMVPVYRGKQGEEDFPLITSDQIDQIKEGHCLRIKVFASYIQTEERKADDSISDDDDEPPAVAALDEI